jgi:hypothetical protein
MARSSCLLRIPWPRWAQDAGHDGGAKDAENWKATERWAQHLLDECMPAAVSGDHLWASYEAELSVGNSGTNISNTIVTEWTLEYEGTAGSGFGVDLPYVACPPGVYIWTLELWGFDNWDGIINYTTSPTPGTACGVVHTEVIGLGGAFSKPEYYDEPVFDGISGGALVRTGTTVTTSGFIYVEYYLQKVSWLTLSSASGGIRAHLTIIRVGDAPIGPL